MDFDWRRAFPDATHSVVADLVNALPAARHRSSLLIDETHSRSWPGLLIGGQAIEIPYRIDNTAPMNWRWRRKSPLQNALLGCIYSRHSNGFVRQATLPTLVASTEPFVAPFLVQLLGEYVVEIAQDIVSAVDTHPTVSGLLKTFASEYPSFVELTESRARSYWSAYYRADYVQIAEYPAVAALTRITNQMYRRVICKTPVMLLTHLAWIRSARAVVRPTGFS